MNKHLTAAVLAAIFAFHAPANATEATADHVPGENASMALGAKTVLGAIRALGSDATLHKDAKGNPHLVVKDKVGEAREVAVFFDDCGSEGCEDLILYAAFPANEKVTDSVLNEWNHVTSRLRSKAARSSNGDLTISLPISFLTHDDQEKLSMLMGLFFFEVNFMSATINKNS
jgi:hypothetical protein